MLFGLLFGILLQIAIHGCTLLDHHGGSDSAAASAQHHRVIIVVPKEIKHIHHYKYIHSGKGGGGGGHKDHHHHHHHHHNEKVPQHHTPHKVHHTYEPEHFKQSPSPNLNNYPQLPVLPQLPTYNNYPQLPLHDSGNYNRNPATPVYETPVFNVGHPSRQEVNEILAQRKQKLADRIKPIPSKGFSKSPPAKEAKYLSFGFKTPAKSGPIRIPGLGVQTPRTNQGNDIPKFDEPYKFQDPFVNAFPQLEQAFNIHSNLRGHTANQVYSTGGAYLTNNLENYNDIQQNAIQTQSDQPFDPYAHITHHPHGLVHVNLGSDGQIKQIEINNNGDFQAHLENNDDDNENEVEASEEEAGGGGEGEEEGEREGDDGEDEFEGFDDFLKEDNQKKSPYSRIISHGRSLDSIYPKGPMVFSHEHYDVTPKYDPLPQHQIQQHPLQQHALQQHPLHQPPLQQHPLQQHALQQHALQQHHLQQQPLQQNHLVTPTPAPSPLQPLYHRQFVPIQHLQAPSQEEHNQFVPLQNFNYNTFKK